MSSEKMYIFKGARKIVEITEKFCRTESRKNNGNDRKKTHEMCHYLWLLFSKMIKRVRVRCPTDRPQFDRNIKNRVFLE
jgi:hypothetical protein